MYFCSLLRYCNDLQTLHHTIGRDRSHQKLGRLLQSLAKVGEYFCPYFDHFRRGAQAMGRKKSFQLTKKLELCCGCRRKYQPKKLQHDLAIIQLCLEACCSFEEPFTIDSDICSQEVVWRPLEDQHYHEGQAEEARTLASLQSSFEGAMISCTRFL